ncbi:hypothetical protein L0244_17330 [bacterium]|nr:hypothetical protein [bacterium]
MTDNNNNQQVVMDEYQAALETIKQLKLHPQGEQIMAIYVVQAYTSTFVSVDPNLTDEVKMDLLKRNAIAFLRNMLKVQGQPVDLMSDQSVLEKFIGAGVFKSGDKKIVGV